MQKHPYHYFGIIISFNFFLHDYGLESKKLIPVNKEVELRKTFIGQKVFSVDIHYNIDYNIVEIVNKEVPTWIIYMKLKRFLKETAELLI